MSEYFQNFPLANYDINKNKPADTTLSVNLLTRLKLKEAGAVNSIINGFIAHTGESDSYEFNRYCGSSVPIPTLPADVIRIFSPEVLNARAEPEVSGFLIYA